MVTDRDLVDDQRAMISILALDDLLAGAAALLRDLCDATSEAHDREARRLSAAADRGAGNDHITVPPELGAAWRHVVRQ
jgi:hypothetical protein